MNNPTTTFYKKVDDHFVPVSEYDPELTDSFPYGSTLIVVKQGSRSYKYNVDPAIAPTIAALTYAKDKMSAKLVEASEAKPKHTPITESQRQAVDHLKKEFGLDMFYISFPSANDIVDAGMAELTLEIEKLLSVPAVKKAYDNFMLLAKLAYENKEI